MLNHAFNSDITLSELLMLQKKNEAKWVDSNQQHLLAILKRAATCLNAKDQTESNNSAKHVFKLFFEDGLF